MKGIDYFAWFVFLVILASIVFVFVFMGMWPGKTAKKLNHPQAKAIQIAGWVTLICVFPLWPVAVIWAYHLTPEQRAQQALEPSTGGAAEAQAAEGEAQ